MVPPVGDALGRIHDTPGRKLDIVPSRHMCTPAASRKYRLLPDQADIVAPSKSLLSSSFPAEVNTRNPVLPKPLDTYEMVAPSGEYDRRKSMSLAIAQPSMVSQPPTPLAGMEPRTRSCPALIWCRSCIPKSVWTRYTAEVPSRLQSKRLAHAATVVRDEPPKAERTRLPLSST